jgi:hypothetical protein
VRSFGVDFISLYFLRWNLIVDQNCLISSLFDASPTHDDFIIVKAV